jgi:hypothetical protein
MAITEAFSVTETVSTTEWSMATDAAGPGAQTGDGVFQVFLDLNALAAGDVFELKIYEKVQSASTQRLIYSARFAGAQGAPGWASPSLILLHGWDVTLKKISGTDRSILGSIRSVA